MSTYAAVSDFFFRVASGFCIAQLLVPPAFFAPAPTTTNPMNIEEPRAVYTVRKSVQEFSNRWKPTRTLEQDLVHYQTTSQSLFIFMAAVLVSLGGPLSLLGGAISVCFRGPSGDERYRRLKRATTDPSLLSPPEKK